MSLKMKLKSLIYTLENGSEGWQNRTEGFWDSDDYGVTVAVRGLL